MHSGSHMPGTSDQSASSHDKRISHVALRQRGMQVVVVLAPGAAAALAPAAAAAPSKLQGPEMQPCWPLLSWQQGGATLLPLAHSAQPPVVQQRAEPRRVTVDGPVHGLERVLGVLRDCSAMLCEEPRHEQRQHQLVHALAAVQAAFLAAAGHQLQQQPGDTLLLSLLQQMVQLPPDDGLQQLGQLLCALQQPSA